MLQTKKCLKKYPLERSFSEIFLKLNKMQVSKYIFLLKKGDILYFIHISCDFVLNFVPGSGTSLLIYKALLIIFKNNFIEFVFHLWSFKLYNISSTNISLIYKFRFYQKAIKLNFEWDIFEIDLINDKCKNQKKSKIQLKFWQNRSSSRVDIMNPRIFRKKISPEDMSLDIFWFVTPKI